jgi:uncharacterized protein YciI
VLLKRPPTPPVVSAEEGATIQKAHIAHLEKLGNDGFGMAAGPFADDGEILQKEHLAYMTGQARAGRLVLSGPITTETGTRRGIVVYRATSIEEARKLAEADPMVRVGRLALELHPWMTAKGVLPLK